MSVRMFSCPAFVYERPHYLDKASILRPDYPAEDLDSKSTPASGALGFTYDLHFHIIVIRFYGAMDSTPEIQSLAVYSIEYQLPFSNLILPTPFDWEVELA